MAVILIVEDDHLIATALHRELTKAGHEPTTAGSLADARPELAAADLVLCDLGLPDGNGLDLIAEVARSWPGLPVIAVTARAEQADVIAGLNGGAVDYLTKPFALAELLARVQAQLRQAAVAVDQRNRSRLLALGDLSIDVGTREVRVQGTSVALRPKEFDLLVRLARARGAVVPRADLMRDVWGGEWWGSTKTLDVHINSLRRKLGEDPGTPRRILTVRGVGYRMDPSA